MNLAEEVTTNLALASWIYCLAGKRDLARQGKATVGLNELTPPIEQNKDTLRAHGYEEVAASKSIDQIAGEAEVVEFVPDAEDELVHAIVVNHSQETITVVFRGTVTMKDCFTDIKIPQTKVGNPAHRAKLDTNAPEEISLHYGFFSRVFQKKSPVYKNMNRYRGIILSLKKLLSANTGYKVYTTGHSLGGALCTLFGFYAAVDEDIMKSCNGPIRVISVASPRVGNVQFLMAFQSLEDLGRLRHLRVANAEDVVSIIPCAGLNIGKKDLKIGSDVYRHCGIELHLNDPSKNSVEPLYKFTYNEKINTPFESRMNFWKSLCRYRRKLFRYHSCKEYGVRVNAVENQLQNVTLDDLYKDKKIVGDTMIPGYVFEETKEGIEMHYQR